jgi:hypothetical protein
MVTFWLISTSVASNVKQEKAMRNHTMRALVHTPNHYGHGGEVGVVGRLV